MDGEKAPGPDGFTMVFLKNCWDVKSDLIRVFSEFFKRSTINKSMNSTFIILIPKRNGLLSSVYKIIGKFCQSELGRS